jgi:uncharacterized zinc-type alcohol dehydrogenase-like protein
MKIHAHAALHRGKHLQPWTYNSDELQPHQVLVQVQSCGVCWSDIDMIDDNRGSSEYPLVPGHEIVGEVIETGSSVTHHRSGDPVGIGWWRSACLRCEMCLSGRENLCPQRKGTIVHGKGGFAGALIVDDAFAYPWLDGLDPVRGAPLLCAGHAVFGALSTAGMTSRQEIGVIGVGGLGHLAIQFAAAQGNRVTAFTHSPDKADTAAHLGAHDVVVLGSDEPPHAPRKLDILLSTAPTNLDFNAWIELLGPDGVLAFSSNPPEPIELNVGALMVWRRRILGNPTGGRSMMVNMLQSADRYGIEPIVETYSMADVNKALSSVRENTVRHRAVLTI